MRDAAEFWTFPVKSGVSFKNAEKVHPLMQTRIEKILKAAEKEPNIKKLVLFGSSLEFRCSSYSDIDLYAETYDPDLNLRFLPELDCEVDLITNLPHDVRLYKEIDRTGLLLFER